MKLTLKEYHIKKTKAYLKENSLILFFSGINKNSNDWIYTEQRLKTMNFNYYKVLNSTTSKTLKNSIYNNFKAIIHGPTFMMKPADKKTFSISLVLKNFEDLSFVMLCLKLNNKIYSTEQSKDVYSLNYYESKLLFSQYIETNLKVIFLSK